MCKKHKPIEEAVVKAIDAETGIETFEDDAYMENVEGSDDYKRFKKETEKALSEQWQQLIYAGAIALAYRDFQQLFQIANEKGEEIPKPALSTIQDILIEKIYRKIPGVATGNTYKQDTRNYLRTIMNKGGQVEINKIISGKVFNLTSKEPLKVITQRAERLIKGIDQSTAKRFSSVVLGGLKQGLSQQEVAKKLMAVDKKLSKGRADRIARTESKAAHEYMRAETARKNGVAWKTWRINWRETTCPVCSRLANQTVRIDKPFLGSPVDLPPVHPNCGCWIEYDYNRSLCSNYVKGFKDVLDFQKKSGDLYPASEEEGASCVNPNAVWTGGAGIEGLDNKIGSYASNIDLDKDFYVGGLSDDMSWDKIDEYSFYTQDLYNEDINIFRANIENSVISTEIKMKLMSLSDGSLNLISARINLSDEGFAQLMKVKGFRGFVPKKSYVDLSRVEERIAMIDSQNKADEILITELTDNKEKILPELKNKLKQAEDEYDWFRSDAGRELKDKDRVIWDNKYTLAQDKLDEAEKIFRDTENKISREIDAASSRIKGKSYTKEQILQGKNVGMGPSEATTARLTKTYKMTLEEHDALYSYMTADYSKYNKALLTGTVTDELKDKIKNLDSALKLMPARETESYRGMSLSEEDFNSLFKPGGVFKSKSYMSTSSDDEVATKFAKTNKPGLRGVYVVIEGKNGKAVSPFSPYIMGSEEEILYSRGTTFRVQNTWETDDGLLGVRLIEEDILQKSKKDHVNYLKDDYNWKLFIRILSDKK